MAYVRSVLALAWSAGVAGMMACSGGGPVMAAQAAGPVTAAGPATLELQAHAQLNAGRRVFRFDTFGDEAFWGGALRLHEAIEGAGNGGVGPGVTPRTALAVGLKVDATALPGNSLSAIRQGR